jgi:Fe2+ or Zn2+ uptake regulation protein
VEALSDTPHLAKNYRLVHEIVHGQGPGVHLTMAQIHDLAAQRKPGLGFTTVYRALTKLRDLGLVSEIILPGADRAFYEAVAPAHAHFRCDACGRVDDIEYLPPEQSVRELAGKYGIEVRETLLSLHGLCAGCRAVTVAPATAS